MSTMEHLFDINSVLKNSYITLKQLREEKQIELIFDMDTTIPRELRGNDVVFQQLLATLLSFVFQNSTRKELLLSLSAPKDFLYEESISFKMNNTDIPKEKVLAFLETGLGNNLKILNGNIVYDNESDIHLKIPFTIGELGYRRHYRLPTKTMLEKKVLLVVKSQNVMKSMGKMFKYFPYDVDFARKEKKVHLSKYDLVVIEDHLVTESFSHKISQIQEKTDLKYVIWGNDNNVNYAPVTVSTHLSRPVTQESIFELIVLLFSYDTPQKKKKIVTSQILEDVRQPSDIVVPESLKMKPEDQGLQNLIEEKKSQHVAILDTRLGLENAKKKGLLYSQELENFIENFNKSDLYFRQIVNEKQTNKIKDFCIDLEKQAKIIGAESMLKFSDTVSLIFVYDKLDMLPIYPGRYHMELTKLVSEIKKYLYI